MDIDEHPPPQPPIRPPGSTTPAGLELRLKLLSLFCKSAAAANCFPQTLEVWPEAAMYSASQNTGFWGWVQTCRLSWCTTLAPSKRISTPKSPLRLATC